MPRTVRCRWCGQAGHNQATCPKRKAYVAANPDSPHARYDEYKKKKRAFRAQHAPRSCSFCREAGHTARTCAHHKAALKAYADLQSRFRKAVLKDLVTLGLAPGAVVLNNTGPDKGTKPYMVTRIGLDMINLLKISAAVNAYEYRSGIVELESMAPTDGYTRTLYRGLKCFIGEDYGVGRTMPTFARLPAPEVPMQSAPLAWLDGTEGSKDFIKDLTKTYKRYRPSEHWKLVIERLHRKILEDYCAMIECAGFKSAFLTDAI